MPVVVSGADGQTAQNTRGDSTGRASPFTTRTVASTVFPTATVQMSKLRQVPVAAFNRRGRRHPCRGAEADFQDVSEDDSDSTATLHRQGGRCHRVQVVEVHRQGGRCPTWCRSCRFNRCRLWRGQSRLQIVGKSLRSHKFHTSGRPTCESLSTALGRPRMATRSSTDGHTIVHGWPHGRPRMATRSSTDGHTVVHGWPHGRPRMATRSSADGHTVVHGWPHGRPRMATRSSTDGHTVVHGWPHGRPRMATRSSTDGHTVVHGWPHGRPRMATRSSTDGHTVVHGWPHGRPRMAGGRLRMAGDQKQGGADVPRYIKMAARVASAR